MFDTNVMIYRSYHIPQLMDHTFLGYRYLRNLGLKVPNTLYAAVENNRPNGTALVSSFTDYNPKELRQKALTLLNKGRPFVAKLHPRGTTSRESD